jgi:23S rRNA (uracil1939-C5)-methyltransferase
MKPPRQPQQHRREQTFLVDIESIGYGGVGLGKRGRKTVSVPFTIPGERVLARTVREDDTLITAEGIRLEDASADRVYPACAAFGKAGCIRCSWQHIAYRAQTLLKQDMLAETLERAGLREPEVLPTVSAVSEWGYLQNVLFTLDAHGRLCLTSREPRQVVQISDCALWHPSIVDLYEALDLDLDPALISRVRLATGDQGSQMITLSLKTDSAPELETDLNASVNVILSDNEPMNLIGDSHLRCTIGGRTFRVTAGSFFRPNLSMIAALVDAVLELLDPAPSDTLLDLYAGVGVFSAFAAARVARVTLIESFPPAVTDADLNLSAFDHIDVIEGGCADVLAALIEDGERYTCAIADAPSPGMGDQVVNALAGLNVERLVVVSDDPQALAKDARRLEKVGFRLRAARAIDLSPQTHFLDSVALFVR